jgi:hypothetical protein
MSAALIFAALKKLELFGYGKSSATYGYHHYVELGQRNQDSVHCVLFLNAASVYKAHEFESKWEDLINFMEKKNCVFEKSLDCDTMLGDVKMCDNWGVDIENLRVGLLKEVQLLLLPVDIGYDAAMSTLSRLLHENGENQLLDGGFNMTMV